jgi:hypothetical protein
VDSHNCGLRHFPHYQSLVLRDTRLSPGPCVITPIFRFNSANSSASPEIGEEGAEGAVFSTRKSGRGKSFTPSRLTDGEFVNLNYLDVSLLEIDDFATEPEG